MWQEQSGYYKSWNQSGEFKTQWDISLYKFYDVKLTPSPSLPHHRKWQIHLFSCSSQPNFEMIYIFLSLLQPTQSENTFISSFKIGCQSSYFLSLSPQLATTFLIYTTIMLHQEACNNFLVSGFCLYPTWCMLYTSARVILLKHLGDYVTSLLKTPHRLSVSLGAKVDILTMASKGAHHSLTSWNSSPTVCLLPHETPDTLTFTQSVSSARNTLYPNFYVISSSAPLFPANVIFSVWSPLPSLFKIVTHSITVTLLILLPGS